MKVKKRTAQTFQGMTYRELQSHNTRSRGSLPQKHQQQLKQEGCRNVGWENVIKIYEKIELIEEQLNEQLPSLESLFLEADRIGNKYQSSEERADFRKEMAAVSVEMSDIVDQQFPDTEIEVIDFRKSRSRR